MSVKHVVWTCASLMLAACDSTSGPNVDAVADNPSVPQVPALPGESGGMCHVTSPLVSSRLSAAEAKPCPNQPPRLEP
jgi:hypothetical protein